MAAIASVDHVAGWQLLQHLVQLLTQLLATPQNMDVHAVDGIVMGISQICEDSDLRKQLESEEAQRVLNVMFQSLISLFHHNDLNVRRAALGTVNQFLVSSSIPRSLAHNFDGYRAGLFYLVADPDMKIRRKVCSAFVALVEKKCEVLGEHLADVINFMLESTQSPDEGVALTACEFWQVYCEANATSKQLLSQMIPKLVPVLLNAMVYSDMELRSITSNEDESVPDRKEDIAPTHHRSKQVGVEEDFDEGGNEQEMMWNLRKCAALALDVLAGFYGEFLFTELLKHLHANLDDRNPWKVRESAVLALGAVAEGIHNTIK